MRTTRKQLTLFIDDASGNIERIRATYNPVQFSIIPAHVTLCREDELEFIDDILARIRTISLEKPLHVAFQGVERSADGKGVFMPSSGENEEFRELRQNVLGETNLKKEQVPHITLMHPRNSTCDDEIFEQIKQYELPVTLEFEKISLIEQSDDGKWKLLQEFHLVKK
ncbi:2'-5' RNA ligase family protein [Salinimicrobium oceani]|uniref:2'-5' RNA ligase family protein n=1 Tax=Salinimicrobium oceani TaxID=2722702 RepID=A0ABX1CZF6_9FLAO|nr:2'-5' RNA ligase family protein [Salinimicrobium oceani]NJW53650.1 2'-5' RNA ligase family protein [Salinimicrobium oceani]